MNIMAGVGIPGVHDAPAGIVQITEDKTFNGDTNVGKLPEGVSFNTNEISIDNKNYESGSVLQANNFKFAKRNSVDEVFTSIANNEIKIVMLGEQDGLFMQGPDQYSNNIYPYSKNTTINDETTKICTTADGGQTWKLVNSANTTPVKVITMGSSEFSVSDDNKSLLYTGNITTKEDGKWKLLFNNDKVLEKAQLTVSDGKILTLESTTTTEEETDANGNTIYNEDETPKMKEVVKPSTVTVTEFGKIDGTIQSDNNTCIIFKSGSSAGSMPVPNRLSPTTISGGTVDLSNHMQMGDGGTFLGTTNNLLFLELYETIVKLFPDCITGNNNVQKAPADETSKFIDSLNDNKQQLFPYVTSPSDKSFTINYVPYVVECKDANGKTFYIHANSQDIKTLFNDANSDLTLSFKSVSPSNITKFFKEGTDPIFDVNEQTMMENFVRAVKAANPDLGDESNQHTLTLKGMSLKNVYPNIDLSNLTDDEGDGKKFKIVINKSNEPVDKYKVQEDNLSIDTVEGEQVATLTLNGEETPVTEEVTLIIPKDMSTVNNTISNMGDKDKPVTMIIPSTTNTDSKVNLELTNVVNNLKGDQNGETKINKMNIKEGSVNISNINSIADLNAVGKEMKSLDKLESTLTLQGGENSPKAMGIAKLVSQYNNIDTSGNVKVNELKVDNSVVNNTGTLNVNTFGITNSIFNNSGTLIIGG